jgi:hypothetical protein
LGPFRGDDDDHSEDREDQVREQLAAGQDVNAGNDDAVEEVEQRTEEGLDGQVVDGATDALEDHHDPEKLNRFAHAPTLRAVAVTADRPSGISRLDRGRDFWVARLTKVSVIGDFGIVAALAGETSLPGR